MRRDQRVLDAYAIIGIYGDIVDDTHEEAINATSQQQQAEVLHSRGLDLLSSDDDDDIGVDATSELKPQVSNAFRFL